MTLQPKAEIVLTVEKPVAGGRMLARHDGRIVFVAGAIPGERVRARVERVSKQLAYAETVEVLDASADRRVSASDLGCGGCLYAHIGYERQLLLKSALVADAFLRIGKIALPAAVPVTASGENGYRMRARLHARNGRFGFFREGTHELCDATQTGQLLPATHEAIGSLRSGLGEALVAGVSSCEICENVPADERVLLLEMDPSHRAPLHIEAIPGTTGVAFMDHSSARLTVGHGSPYVVDRLDIDGTPVTLTHHVQSFFQGNRHLLTRLAEQVVSRVPQGDVTDLYAGVGLFAVALAARGGTGIVAVEGDRSSARDLDANASVYAGAIAVEHMSVENYLQGRRTRTPATILLDPPRTGLSPEAMSGLLGLKPPRLVYVSCDVATLARDVKRFVEAGYALTHIEAFDLFPNTAHVETLVVLIRGERTPSTGD